MAIGLTLGLSLAGNTALSFAAPIVLDQSAFFPASTAANTGGFKPFDTNGNEVDLVSVDDQTGTTRTWSIASGRLVANGTPDVDNGDTITVTDAYDNSIVLTIDSATAGECYASFSELSTLFGTDLSGRHLFGRPGSYIIVGGNGFFNGDFNDLSSVVTLDACSAANRPIWDRLAIFSTTSPTTDIGNVTVQNMQFTRNTTEDDKLTGNISASTSGLVQIEDAGGGIPEDVIIQNCNMYSNYPIARNTGTRPADTIYGVWVKDGSRINVNQNTFSYLMSPALIENTNTGSFNENVATHTWDDMLKLVDSIDNFEVHDNECHSFIGDHGFHPDFIHMYQASGSHDMNTVSVRGNIGYPNTEGALAPAWPTSDIEGALTREAGYETANRTLSDADGDAFIIADVSGGSLTFTLSDPASAGSIREMAVQLRAVGGTVSNQVTIDANGHTLYDVDNAENITSWALIEPWETVLLRVRPGEDRWSLARVGAIYQGSFTNANGLGYKNIDVDYNLFWTVGALNGVRYDGVSSDNVNVSRTMLLQAWPGDLNGKSRANSHANGGPTRQGQFDYDGTNGAVANSMGSALSGTFTGSNNALSANVDPTTWAGMTANFNVADAGVEEHFPTSKAEAISMARPKVGSYMDTNSIGPLGTALDGSGDLYNYGQVAGELGPIVQDISFTELRTTRFTDGTQNNSKTVTTEVAATGNHPALVLVETRYTGAGSTNQNITATLDGNSMTEITDGDGTNFQVTAFYIASSSVPASTFDVVVSNGTANFNGCHISVYEMVNAADDQSGAAVGATDTSASTTSVDGSVTTTAAGSVVVAMYAGLPALSSITGGDTTYEDGTVNIGNSVSFAGEAILTQATAGSATITFTQSGSANQMLARAFEVLKA